MRRQLLSKRDHYTVFPLWLSLNRPNSGYYLLCGVKERRHLNFRLTSYIPLPRHCKFALSAFRWSGRRQIILSGFGCPCGVTGSFFSDKRYNCLPRLNVYNRSGLLVPQLGSLLCFEVFLFPFPFGRSGIAELC